MKGWVPADGARKRLEHWRRQGVGQRRCASLTGLALSTIQAILRGRARIHADTERAIVETVPSLADGALVSEQASYQTRERIRRLKEEKFSWGFLKRELGHKAIAAIAVPRRDRPVGRVRVRTWKRVMRVQRQLDWGDTDRSALGDPTC